MSEDRALYRDFTYTQFRDSEFKDTKGLVNVLPAELRDNLVSAWRLRVREPETPDELSYDIWVYAYDLAHYPTFKPTMGIPRFIYEAEVFIQRDSEQGPSVNLKYAVKSPSEAIDTARAVWTSLGCPTHVI